MTRWLATALLVTLGACSEQSPAAPERTVESATTQPPVTAEQPEATAAATPGDRQVYFGDLHVHTWWSFDAYSLGVRVGPRNAYRYVRGEPIDHISGEQIQMQAPPLDFLALTEHAEYMGVSVLANEPDHPIRQIKFIRDLASDDPQIRTPALGRFAAILSGSEPVPELLTDEIVTPVWRRIIALADEYYQPGEFTTFVAYEYTSMPDGQNVHRNVIFAGTEVPPRPFSSVDSPNPEDLWQWMDDVRAAGSDLIAIPHNANASNGLMYAQNQWDGSPMDATYAAQRMRNEPVSEVFQIKGQSETHPTLSPRDQWAGFEQFDRILGRMTEASEPEGSFVRRALLRGLESQANNTFNPYRIGVIGSSDGHNASSPVEENNYTGKIGMADDTPERRLVEQLSPALPNDAVSRWGAAGLAGVWADDNSREAIFSALRRQETFATSGPRIRARFFGGWELNEPAVADLVTTGYEKGVPMGGQLTARDGQAPGFLYWALKDPNEAPLERVQIVKLWYADGAMHERVIDVTCANDADIVDDRCALESPPPDPNTCEVLAQGAVELKGHWRDATHDPRHHAAYYLRVLQVPTCRWSTYDARKLEIEVPAHLPFAIQERAVTSAVWVTPAS